MLELKDGAMEKSLEKAYDSLMENTHFLVTSLKNHYHTFQKSQS